MSRHVLDRVASLAQSIRGLSPSGISVPEQPAVVLVVVDATKKFDGVALMHAYTNIVQPGEKLVLLGIMDHINTLLGCKTATAEDGFNATNKRALEAAKIRVSQIYETALGRFAGFCDSKQVLLEIMIGTGSSFSRVLVPQATQLQPRCIVLDRHLKSQKTCLAQNLNCELLLMNGKGEADIVASKDRSLS